MDTETYDPLNPFFKYDLDKLCAVCTQKLIKEKTFSLKKPVDDNGKLQAYQVLETISNFKYKDNGTHFICHSCFQNTIAAYRFQKLCNKTQSFLDKYLEHQHRLANSVESDENTEGNKLGTNEPKTVTKISTRRKVMCKICNKLYTADNIITHRRTHSGERPYKCKQCGATFTQWASLNYHKASHENKRSFVCHYCASTFNSAGGLTRHEKIHTNEKPHKCLECEMSFSTRSYLKRHVVCHTGEKTFTCEFCSKSFNRKSTLIVHQKIHTGEKPHVCAFCDKSFIQLQSLKSHLRTHPSVEIKGESNKDVIE